MTASSLLLAASAVKVRESEPRIRTVVARLAGVACAAGSTNPATNPITANIKHFHPFFIAHSSTFPFGPRKSGPKRRGCLFGHRGNSCISAATRQERSGGRNKGECRRKV